jgi:reactive intermediate/imine deaminase
MIFHGPRLIGPGGQELPLSLGVSLGDLVFLSGQVALRDGKLSGGIVEQTHIILNAIEAILADAQLTLDNVAKSTIWLTDAADFADFNKVYADRFRTPYPVRSTVVSQLAVPGALIEIEVVASRTGSRQGR